MEQKRTYNIPNRNGIEATLNHAQSYIEDGEGGHYGDDRIILAIPDFKRYDTDLCQDGNIYLHFSKAEARRLSRILWQLSARLMTAEEREAEDMGDFPGIVVDPNFFKDFQKMFGYGKRTKRKGNVLH